MRELHASQNFRALILLRSFRCQSCRRREFISLNANGTPAPPNPRSKPNRFAGHPTTSHEGLTPRRKEGSSSRLWESLLEFVTPEHSQRSATTRYSQPRLITSTKEPKESTVLKEAEFAARKSSISQAVKHLESLWEDETSILTIWDVCTSLRPLQRKRLTVEELATLQESQIFVEIFRSIIKVAISSRAESTPKLFEVFCWYQDHGLLSLDMLHELISQALLPVAEYLFAERGFQELGSESQGLISLRLLEELIKVWHCSMQHPILRGPVSTRPLKNAPLGFPNMDIIEKGQIFLPSNYADRFQHFFPATRDCARGRSIAADAAVTYLCYHYMRKSGLLPDAVLSQAVPWASAVARMVNGTRDETSLLFSETIPAYGLTFSLSGRFRDYWSKMLFELREQFSKEDVTPQVPGRETTFPKQMAEPTHSRDVHDISSRMFLDLRKVTRGTDTHRALKLWKNFLEKDLLTCTQKHRDTMLTEFLWSFVRLGLIENVLKIWNMLPKLKIKPTASHWAAMIEACKRHRDLISLKSIWKEMVTSGELPRNPAWTAYINALLFCRDVNGALAAMNEMGKAWDSQSSPDIASVTGDIPETLRPSIVPINAALSGVIDMFRSESVRSPYIESVLSWSRKRQITPNIDTYNILLRPAARKSDQQQVQLILANMKAHNCVPNVVTFTILIDGIFRNPSSSFRSRSVSEQQSIVEKAFYDMESVGIFPTARTYSTILDSLLSGPHPNLPAGQAVLKRMGEQKVKASSHIYTILIHHYFDSDPPNLVAIDALWRRIELEQTVVDHVFFDRMIEGYARVGETEKMLSFLRVMPQKGKVPGWVALTMALNALAKKGDWDVVEEIVHNVEHKDGYTRLGVWGWQWKEGWSALVADLRGRGLIADRRN